MAKRLGLVIGKFYPPHKGHHYLIDTALAACDQVVVFVCDLPSQSIPAVQRAAWLREAHPRADVRVIRDIEKDDDSVAWALHTMAALGRAPDAVFTSEDYGVPYAAAMGCEHVCVDPLRVTHHISGTMVRANPYCVWEFLSPPVRAYFTKRVVVLGAESTGTTTLAAALANSLGTVWVPEYGRFYSQGRYTTASRVWRSEEFTHIARMQGDAEDHLARSAERLIVCDTDPFATQLWHEYFMGEPSPEVAKVIAERPKPDLYLLTGDEIPFEQDGLRDGGPQRHAMHRRFEAALPERGVPWQLLRGTPEHRLTTALQAIEKAMGFGPLPQLQVA